jgi:hypothetical protein
MAPPEPASASATDAAASVPPPVVVALPASKPRPVAPAPAQAFTKGAKCSDILQKASLEPLTAGETAYLKKECR